MATAKDVTLKPIPAKIANDFVRRVHYSGKVVNNSQLHIGAFLDGVLHGAMQFGPSLDKRKIQGLVRDTKWHEFIELNRLAFDDVLPRNSESRAIAIAIKMIKKHAPQIKWVISFADATQCGDGTIYRASGFVLTGIKENNQIWRAPTGENFSRTSLTDKTSKNEKKRAADNSRTSVTKGRYIHSASHGGGASMKKYIEAGFEPLDGFQLRYIYFIDKSYRQKLTVPEIPFSQIKEIGAAMYKGKKM
jgi:hypothetical protein